MSELRWEGVEDRDCVLYLRLFQHTFGTHPEQPLPTGYNDGDSFHRWRGNRGIAVATGVRYR